MVVLRPLYTTLDNLHRVGKPMKKKEPESDGDQSTSNHANSLTHTYGVLSVVPSFIGIVVAIKQSADVAQWLLLASGWVAAIFLAVFLIHMSKQFSREVGVSRSRARADGLTIGRLETRVEDLHIEIERRHATLDYLSGLLIGTRVTPRQTAQPQEALQDRDDDQED